MRGLLLRTRPGRGSGGECAALAGAVRGRPERDAEDEAADCGGNEGDDRRACRDLSCRRADGSCKNTEARLPFDRLDRRSTRRQCVLQIDRSGENGGGIESGV
ncbi:MAG: hypothetical protein FJW20_01790 [Acidimicrobiia bacterium]|nr:hypothetical protein [Acidimicrobiia bacterium]